MENLYFDGTVNIHQDTDNSEVHPCLENGESYSNPDFIKFDADDLKGGKSKMSKKYKKLKKKFKKLQKKHRALENNMRQFFMELNSSKSKDNDWLKSSFVRAAPNIVNLLGRNK